MPKALRIIRIIPNNSKNDCKIARFLLQSDHTLFELVRLVMQKNNIFTFWISGIEAIESSFRICVWNVHKCLSKKLHSDIENIFHDFDIVLMQEAIMSDTWTNIWKNITDFNWDFFRSFSMSKNRETGVLIGSKYHQKIMAILPSVDREPLLRTPKATGMSLINIAWRSEKLLIVNTHAMNFNFGKPFLRQIESIAEAIKDHVWPMIWAGDFNTWSRKRTRLLGEIAHTLGLEWLMPENDRRFLKLDHILYRGITPRYAEVRHDIKTSDHFPLFAEFEII